MKFFKSSEGSQNTYCRTCFANVGGFTLAEVLITIGIIGVVAAMTLPVLIRDVEERVNTERQVNIVQKVTQAMEQMKAHGDLMKFSNTNEFVDEFQKYIKVAKRCSGENISECWPTKTVISASGSKYKVEDAKSGADLGFEGRDDNENVGLVLSDGMSIILTYNPDTLGMGATEPTISSTISLPVGGNKYKDFGYTTDVTGGLAFVMDVNGKGAPNSETVNGKYNDIRSFNGARFVLGERAQQAASCIGTMSPKGCVYQVSSYGPILCNEFSVSQEPDYAKFCGSYLSNRSDYWAGARKACDDIGMKLPSLSELESLASTSWDGQPNFSSNFYWTSTEVNSSCACVVTNTYSTCSCKDSQGHKGGRFNTVCISK